jgi:hypothetical protein
VLCLEDQLRLGSNLCWPNLCRYPSTVLEVLKRNPDPRDVHWFEPFCKNDRPYDFTVITGTKEKNSQGIPVRKFCVIFVQCCSGSRHQDSFRDLVQNGDPFWQGILPPGKCYLGYLWITPTGRMNGVPRQGTSSVPLVLDQREVLFRRLRYNAWDSVIGNRDLSYGRTGDSFTQHHGWKGFPSIQEMHLTVSMARLKR